MTCVHHNLPVDPIDGLCDKCAQFMFDNRLYSDRAMFMDECRDAADGGHIILDTPEIDLSIHPVGLGYWYRKFWELDTNRN